MSEVEIQSKWVSQTHHCLIVNCMCANTKFRHGLSRLWGQLTFIVTVNPLFKKKKKSFLAIIPRKQCACCSSRARPPKRTDLWPRPSLLHISEDSVTDSVYLKLQIKQVMHFRVDF